MLERVPVVGHKDPVYIPLSPKEIKAYLLWGPAKLFILSYSILNYTIPQNKLFNILTSFLKNEGLYNIDYIEPYNKGKNHFIDGLGFYLAGLLEGDGYISKPNNSNSFRPRIVFTFHIQNLPMFIYLQFLLGGAGRMVTEYPVTNTSRYILSDHSSIIKLIYLIKNKLR